MRQYRLRSAGFSHSKTGGPNYGQQHKKIVENLPSLEEQDNLLRDAYWEYIMLIDKDFEGEGTITEPFLHFPAGTRLLEIEQWFDERVIGGIDPLQNGDFESRLPMLEALIEH